MKTKLKFLLIDDDHVFNFLHSKHIEKLEIDHDVTCFESPTKAFWYLNNLSVDSLPDIIFLDINMPELNGFELLQKVIQEREEIMNNLNIFIVTSSLNPTDYEESKKYDSIKGYYNKPIDSEKLMTTVNWLLNKDLEKSI
ncbi:MAG: response regulator [Flavobacteriaceae bacterium]|nr:response regulator [Flavobacteriaceae bacterium]